MLIAGDEDAQGVNITLLAAPDCHTVLGFQHNDAPSFLMADSTPLEVLCRNEQKKKVSSRPICDLTATLTAIEMDNCGRWWTMVDDGEHRGANPVCATMPSLQVDVSV
jgi:hypothetical protein